MTHPLDGNAIAANAHYGRFDADIGTDEGDTCNRLGCDGMIGPDDEGILICGVCEHSIGTEFCSDIVTELRGKSLACWCPPGSPCHADVLLEIANK